MTKQELTKKEEIALQLTLKALDKLAYGDPRLVAECFNKILNQIQVESSPQK